LEDLVARENEIFASLLFFPPAGADCSFGELPFDNFLLLETTGVAVDHFARSSSSSLFRQLFFSASSLFLWAITSKVSSTRFIFSLICKMVLSLCTSSFRCSVSLLDSSKFTWRILEAAFVFCARISLTCFRLAAASFSLLSASCSSSRRLATKSFSAGWLPSPALLV
jgi:hypothetical protein